MDNAIIGFAPELDTILYHGREAKRELVPDCSAVLPDYHRDHWNSN